MSTAIAQPRKKADRFVNGAEWWHAIGDVPLRRVVFNPPPGTARENDLLRLLDMEKRPCELIDGTLVEKTVGSWESLVAFRISLVLGAFITERRLGVCMGEQGPSRTRKSRVRMPDISFFSADQFPDRKIPQVSIMAFSPALAVEVLSKGNTKREMRQKRAEYFAAQTREVWLVDPKHQTLAIYERGDSDAPTRVFEASQTLEVRKLLQGFRLKLSEIFSPEF